MPVMPRPDILDFDGFVMRRGHHTGRAAARPPDLKQATLVKSLASIRKSTVDVSSKQNSSSEAAGGTFELRFTFDAIKPGKMLIFTSVSEVEHNDTLPGGKIQRSIELMAVPAPTQDSPAAGENTLREPACAAQEVQFNAGLGQAFTSRALPIQDMVSYDHSRPTEIPLAVLMVTDAEDPGHIDQTADATPESATEDSAPPRSIHYTYISISSNKASDSSSNPDAQPRPSTVELSGQVISQKLEHSNQCFILYEVFGAGPKDRPGDSEGQAANHDVDGNPDCVICLSEPRDTAVLPCRHMCFCSYCAGIVRLQCDRCPVCRQKVQSLLQFKQEEPVAKTATAAPTGGYSKAEERQTPLPAGGVN